MVTVLGYELLHHLRSKLEKKKSTCQSMSSEDLWMSKLGIDLEKIVEA